MGKLNAKKQPVGERLRARADATENYEGGLAFEASPEGELFTRVATCMWEEPKFYEEPAAAPSARGYPYGPQRNPDPELSETGRRILALARSVDPEFVMRLAVYARQELHLRTVPQVLLTEVANRKDLEGEDKTFVVEAAADIMSRADEPGEVLAYQLREFGRPVPQCIRRALRNRMNRLSEYEAFKYRGANRDISLHDVLNMARPEPKDERQEALFNWLIEGELDEDLLPQIAAREKLLSLEEFGPEAVELIEQSHATWQDVTGQFGSTPEVWSAVHLPYMALLRNLRNLLEADALTDEHLATIRDPERVRKSKQFPYRFWSAYRALTGAQVRGMFGTRQTPAPSGRVPENLLSALREAVAISGENMPHLAGTTAIFTDHSGSMDNPVTEKSLITRAEIGFVLSALAHRCCDDVVVGVFGEDYRMVYLNADADPMTNVEKLASNDVGHSTYGWKAIRWLRNEGVEVDRILVFSDMQLYAAPQPGPSRGHNYSLAEEMARYRSEINSDARLVTIDLAGYGTLQMPEDDPLTLIGAGWSEKVLDFIPLWEEGGESALDKLRGA
jgi:hypothetical protein